MGGQHYPGSASSQDHHAQTSDSVSEVATTAWYPLTTVNVTTDTPQVKLSVAIGKMSRNVQEVDQKQQLHQGKTSRRHGLGHPALNLPSTCQLSTPVASLPQCWPQQDINQNNFCYNCVISCVSMTVCC